MSTVRTLPYRRASPDRVSLSPWHLGTLEAGAQLGDYVPDWDPSTPLQLTRHVHIDVDGLRADTRIPEDARLALVLRWQASSTHIKGRAWELELPASGQCEAEAEARLPAEAVGGSLTLSMVVVLVTAVPKALVRAWLPGTILWEDEVVVRVEGGASRFPMESLPFSTAPWSLPKGAPWHLEFELDELELPVLGATRLYLNTEHPAVQVLVDDLKGPQANLVQAMLEYDLARTLVLSAVQSDAFAEHEGAWPVDSLGRAMQRLLKSNFRGHTVSTLRTMLRDDPVAFEALLKTRLNCLAQVKGS